MDKKQKKRSSYIVRIKLRELIYNCGAIESKFNFLTHDDTVVGQTSFNTSGGYILSDEARTALLTAFEILEKDINNIIFGDNNEEQEKPKTLTEKRLDQIIEEE